MSKIGIRPDKSIIRRTEAFCDLLTGRVLQQKKSGVQTGLWEYSEMICLFFAQIDHCDTRMCSFIEPESCIRVSCIGRECIDRVSCF